MEFAAAQADFKPANPQDEPDRPPSPARRLGFQLLVILFYLLAALAYTWPLALNFSDHTAGSLGVDRDQNLWYLWWVREALTHYHANPYFTPLLYYPEGTGLYLFPSNLVSGLLSLPLQSRLGLVPAFNLLYLLGIISGAYGAYCLAKYLTNRTKAALLAGLVYAFAPWQFPATDFNQLNIAQLGWLPFYLLWLVKLANTFSPAAPLIPRLPRPDSSAWVQPDHDSLKYRVRYATLAALCLVLTAYTDQYHLLFAVTLTAGVILYALVKLGVRRKGRDGLALAGWVGLALLVMALAYSPVLLGTFQDARSGAFRDTRNEQIEGADPVSMLIPWFFKDGQKLLQIKQFSAATLNLGWWLTLLLGVYGGVRQKAARLWVGLGALTLVLALGSQLVINGQATGIPMLSGLFTAIPVLSAIHYAWRWLIPAALLLALCLAFGFSLVEKRLLERFQAGAKATRPGLVLPGVVLAAGLAGLFFLDAQPNPLDWTARQVGPTPAIYRSGALKEPGALLELPFTRRNVDWAENMRYQITHGRPLEAGYLARVLLRDYALSPFSFFYEDYPLARNDMLEVKPEALRGMLAHYHFRYLVVYKTDLDKARLDRFRKLSEAVTGGANRCLYEDSETLGCEILPPDQPQPLLTISKGWYGAEAAGGGGGQRWMTGQEAFLGAFAPESGRYTLNFEAAAYLKPRTLWLEVDGRPGSQVEISPDKKAYSLELNLPAGNHYLRFYSPEAPERPSNNGSPGDTRLLSLLFGQVRLTAKPS